MGWAGGGGGYSGKEWTPIAKLLHIIEPFRDSKLLFIQKKQKDGLGRLTSNKRIIEAATGFHSML